jgi:Tfp pilus assembly protein PilX
MTRLRSRLSEEQGIAMLLVVFLIMFLTVLSVTFFEVIRAEGGRASQASNRDTAYQAAEAGVDDYIAKLLDDSTYYVHQVHPGEATRRANAGQTVTAGNAWSYGLVWSYPNGKDTWRQLSNGYEYDLEITAPSAGSNAVRIVSTGRKQGTTTDYRVIEALIRPSSLADFQMLANANITYGSSATTYGKIYAGIDSLGVKHNVTHYGTAYANVYAEGSVLGPPILMNGAQTYDQTNIRTQIKNPINFNSFLTSLVDIQRASQAGGIYLNAATDAWQLTFLNSGQVQVRKCTKSSGRDVADVAPTCGTNTVYNVPSNGAIYSEQTVIVSGVINGRVTVASNDDVVINADITYNNPGSDVLGLVARSDMVVARWCPYNLNWRSATLTQSGSWHSYLTDGSHGTLTFTGSTATNLGGYMNMFVTRNYLYDSTLLYLPPPWFPTVEDAYTTVLFRELAPT